MSVSLIHCPQNSWTSIFLLIAHLFHESSFTIRPLNGITIPLLLGTVPLNNCESRSTALQMINTN